MVIGTVLLVAAAPGLLGTQEAIRQSQQKDKREEHRARRCGLIATCVKSSIRGREVDSRQIVLVNNRLYVDTGTADDSSFGHPLTGYFLPYPDEKYEGLVTTITDAAPFLNWVYIDKETYQVKHGIRENAQPNLHGPFDCTRQDRRLTFEGWEGFVAVEEEPYLWGIYFDRDDNGLRGKVPPGTRVLEIELTRREKKWKKDPAARKEEQGTAHAASESTTLRATPQHGGDQNTQHPARDPPPPQPNPMANPSPPVTNPSPPAKSAAESQGATSKSPKNLPSTPHLDSTKLKLAIPPKTKRVDSTSRERKASNASNQSSSPVDSIGGDESSANSEASSWSGSSGQNIQESQVDYTPTTTPNTSPRKSQTVDNSHGRLETIREERPVEQQLSKEALQRLEQSQSQQVLKELLSTSPDPPPKRALPKIPPPTKVLPQTSPPKSPPRTINTPLYSTLRTAEPNSPYSPVITRQRTDQRHSQQTIKTLASRTTLNLNLEDSKLNPLKLALLKIRRFRSTHFRDYFSRAKFSMTKKMKPKRKKSRVLSRPGTGLDMRS